MSAEKALSHANLGATHEKATIYSRTLHHQTAFFGMNGMKPFSEGGSDNEVMRIYPAPTGSTPTPISLHIVQGSKNTKSVLLERGMGELRVDPTTGELTDNFAVINEGEEKSFGRQDKGDGDAVGLDANIYADFNHFTVKVDNGLVTFRDHSTNGTRLEALTPFSLHEQMSEASS